MAGNEIKVTQQLQITNGAYKKAFAPGTVSVTQTNKGASAGIWTIGTSEEDITFNDITTEGWLSLVNLDPTNYVEYGAAATTPTMATLGRMRFGEPAQFRMEPGVTLRMKANGAPVKVEIFLLEA